MLLKLKLVRNLCVAIESPRNALLKPVHCIENNIHARAKIRPRSGAVSWNQRAVRGNRRASRSPEVGALCHAPHEKNLIVGQSAA